MKNKAFAYLSNNRYWIAILLIFLIGIFFRTYHFSDWLHFELDQSRDAKVIDLAIQEGPSNLPLLGPKAAGSFLRLGPIFYYFKYLSALVFGNTPAGIAIIILIFGILAIPAFYFFIKEYFDRRFSLALLFLFSLSLFLIMYSRFSWNPNPLPLFTILAFYALLKSVRTENPKASGWWLVIAWVSMAIATQMHFLAFVSMPIIFVLFLLIKRPRIKIKYLIISALLVVFLYFPPILNDIKTGGDNIGELLKAVTKKSSDEGHALIEKAVRNYTDNSLGYFLILSGQEKAELPKFNQRKAFVFLDPVCDQDCRDRMPLGTLAFLLYTTGIFLLAKNIYYEKDSRRKNFLILIVLWFLVTFALFIPIAYDIAPRFFLLISALPFVFLGFILEFIESKFKYLSRYVFILVILALALSNNWAVNKRFDELRRAPLESFDITPDRVLKEGTRVTLEQQYLITDYIAGIYAENKYPVYINSSAYYRRSFLYLLEKLEIPRDDFRNSTNSHTIYRHGNYFLIYPTLSNLQPKIEKYNNNYDVVSEKEFGTLTLFQLIPKEEAINAVEQEFEPKGKPKSAPGVPERYTWEEIFSETESEESE